MCEQLRQKAAADQWPADDRHVMRVERARQGFDKGRDPARRGEQRIQIEPEAGVMTRLQSKVTASGLNQCEKRRRAGLAHAGREALLFAANAPLISGNGTARARAANVPCLAISRAASRNPPQAARASAPPTLIRRTPA